MYGAGFAAWLSAMSEWSPALSAFAMILFTAHRAYVAYLKHRGAEYVLAQAEYLRARNEPTVRMRELNIVDRMIDNVRRSLENERAKIKGREEAEAVAIEPETAAPSAKAVKEAA